MQADDSFGLDHAYSDEIDNYRIFYGWFTN